jgi:hypothetical protein
MCSSLSSKFPKVFAGSLTQFPRGKHYFFARPLRSEFHFLSMITLSRSQPAIYIFPVSEAQKGAGTQDSPTA